MRGIMILYLITAIICNNTTDKINKPIEAYDEEDLCEFELKK